MNSEILPKQPILKLQYLFSKFTSDFSVLCDARPDAIEQDAFKILHFQILITIAEISIAIYNFESDYKQYLEFLISVTSPNNRFLKLNLSHQLSDDMISFSEITLGIVNISDFIAKAIAKGNPNIRFFLLSDLQSLSDRLLIFQRDIERLIEYNYDLKMIED